MIDRGDEFEYNTLAKNLAERKVFSVEEHYPFQPSSKREPIYPFFLFLIYKIFGYSFLVVSIFQVFIFSMTILFLYLLISEITDDEIAFYSSILTIICPPISNYVSYLLSESVFIFLLVIFLYVATLTISRRTIKHFVVCGITLGILSLCKAVMLYFLPFLLCCIIITKREKSIFLPIFSLFFSFLIILAPWLFRNHHLFNTWNITTQRGGMMLNVRGMKVFYDKNDYKNAVVYYFSEGLGKIIYPDAIIKSEAFMRQFNSVVNGRDDEPYWRDYIKKKDYGLKEGTIVDLKVSNLQNAGLTEEEIDSILFNEGLQNIKDHPLQYLIGTPLELIKMTSFTYLPLLNEEYITSRINKGIVFLMRGIIRLIAYPILALAFYGIYQYRSKWKELLPIIFVITYTNLFYGLIYGYARYAAPLIPFYVMFATMGWFKLREHKNIIPDQ